MKIRKELLFLVMLCFFEYASAQRYYTVEFGADLVRPSSKIQTKGKPGGHFIFGICSEFSERLSVRTAAGLYVYAYDVTAYDLIPVQGSFYSAYKFAERQVGVTCFQFNYELLFNLYLIKERLALIGGINLGLYPYASVKTYEASTYFTPNKIDQTKIVNNIDSIQEFVENPDFDTRNFIVGPKFGLSFSPSSKIEITAMYNMFLNSPFTTDAGTFCSVADDFKLNFIQLGLVYKFKPSDELRRF
jgi:hypothetical protein